MVHSSLRIDHMTTIAREIIMIAFERDDSKERRVFIRKFILVPEGMLKVFVQFTWVGQACIDIIHRPLLIILFISKKNNMVIPYNVVNILPILGGFLVKHKYRFRWIGDEKNDERVSRRFQFELLSKSPNVFFAIKRNAKVFIISNRLNRFQGGRGSRGCCTTTTTSSRPMTDRGCGVLLVHDDMWR